MKPTTQLAGIVIAFSLLTACSPQVNVKVGVVAPMTGTLGQYGKDMAHGAEIAVDQLNKADFLINGRRAHFELVVEDDKASADEGQAAAQRLIDAGVAGVFGHFNSAVTIAAAPLYAKAGIPQLSVSTSGKYTRMGFKTAFRIAADDIQQGAMLGKLIGEKLHAKSIFVVDDSTTYGIGMADQVSMVIKARNFDPPRESVDAKTADYAALVQKITDGNADAVFFGGDEGVGLPLLKALRKAGSQAKFIAASAMCDPSIIKNAEGSANDNYYCAIAGVPPSWLAAGVEFTQLYNARFGPPGTYSTLAYDGIHIIAQAMQEAKSAKPEVYLPILAKGPFDGKIQGLVEFDGKGDIKDGTVVIYQSISSQLSEQRNLY